MAQAGLHALLGAAARSLTPRREWLPLGILLGSLFPDMDNYAVAVATLTGLDSHGLHRTFTHSLFTVLAAILIFALVGLFTKKPRWTTLGFGLGIGISLHIMLDLWMWYDGVMLAWPLGGWLNLWADFTPPEWFSLLMQPLEFLFLAGYFYWLYRAAHGNGTDLDFLKALRIWIIAVLVLLVIFTPRAYLMEKGFLTIFGAFYLIALTAAFVITIRMRKTVETFPRQSDQLTAPGL